MIKENTLYKIGIVIGVIFFIIALFFFYKVGLRLMNPQILNIGGMEIPLYEHPYNFLPSGFVLIISCFLIIYSTFCLKQKRKQIIDFVDLNKKSNKTKINKLVEKEL